MTSYLLREISQRLDIGPHDVLDACLAAGVKRFTYEGQWLGCDYLTTFLAMRHHDSPVPYLQVDLDEPTEAKVAAELQVSVAEMRFGMESLRS